MVGLRAQYRVIEGVRRNAGELPRMRTPAACRAPGDIDQDAESTREQHECGLHLGPQALFVTPSRSRRKFRLRLFLLLIRVPTIRYCRMDRRWSDCNMSQVPRRFDHRFRIWLSNHDGIPSTDARPLVLTSLLKPMRYPGRPADWRMLQAVGVRFPEHHCP